MVYAAGLRNGIERNIGSSPKSFFHCLGLEFVTVLHVSCPPFSVLQEFEFLKIENSKIATTPLTYRDIGTRPSKGSVQRVCRKISELTEARYGLLEEEEIVRRVNRVINGWGNYFQLGQVSPAYAAVDRHAIRRLRQWLCRKHKAKSGEYARYPDERLWGEKGWCTSMFNGRNLNGK